MTIVRRLVLSLAVGSLLALAFASVAQATHPRPGGGTPFRVPLVPSFNQCTTANQNANHVAPLALDSCAPPTLSSAILTLGAGAQNASARLDVFCAAPSAGPPPCSDVAGDQEDIGVNGSVTDVRCAVGGVPGCAAAGADYTGQLIAQSDIRITDHANQLDPNPGTACANGAGNPPCVAATVLDLTFSVPVQCNDNGGLNGGTCSVSTTIDTLVPTTVKELQRAVVAVFGIRALDAGPDGSVGAACPPFCGTSDETRYLDQGIFIP